MLKGLHKQELTVCSYSMSLLGQLELFRNRVQPASGTLTAVMAEEEESMDKSWSEAGLIILAKGQKGHSLGDLPSR